MHRLTSYTAKLKSLGLGASKYCLGLPAAIRSSRQAVFRWADILGLCRGANPHLRSGTRLALGLNYNLEML